MKKAQLCAFNYLMLFIFINKDKIDDCYLGFFNTKTIFKVKNNDYVLLETLDTSYTRLKNLTMMEIY